MAMGFERYLEKSWEEFRRAGQFDWSPAFDPAGPYGQIPQEQTFFIMTSSTEEAPESIDAQLERNPQRDPSGR